MKRKILLTAILAVAMTEAALGQFYYAGDEPASLRWQYITTPNYKLIFPRGLDSLATAYAKALETSRPKVALSAGYLPGENYWRKTPVVLHPRTGYANGSVAWAPMRVDLYTVYDAYKPETLPWIQELSIHENRHVAQLQFGADGILRPFNWIFGEAATGLFAGLYPSYWMAEGDAVVAETALSKHGRGRSSDFLAYYMTAFDRGDMRNWEKWRWGSWRRYAPNHYALGYMTIAGARYLYGNPMFTSEYLKLASHRPLKASKVRSWFRDHSGKDFNAAFLDIMNSFKETWNADAAARGPFDNPALTAACPKWYTDYSSLAFDDEGNLFAVKSSLVTAASLIQILPDGKERKIRAFSPSTSPLTATGGRLIWTETVQDRRWSLSADSRVRVLEDGKVYDLTKGQRYYNPATRHDGCLSVSDYPYSGGSVIVVLDAEGKALRRFTAPDGVQVVESAWIEDTLYASCISDDGFGIVRILPDGRFESVLPSGPSKINRLKGHGSELYFIDDRNGVGEVYALSADPIRLSRITNTKYGVTDYAVNGDVLYFAARQFEGNLLCRSDIGGIARLEVPADKYYRYAVADTLSAQEGRLAEAAGIGLESQWDGDISAPASYSKLLSAIRIHSWVPLSIDYDAVSSISADDSYKSVALGATVLFQNTLGSLSGIASYRHRTSGSDKGHGRNSFRLNLTYTGLYPVIEGNLNIGERNSLQYKRVKFKVLDLSMERIMGAYIDQPLVDADVKMYIPFNFSKGGWQRGLIPQLRYQATNDRYNRSASIMEIQTLSPDLGATTLFDGIEEGSNVLMQSVYASARGYVIRNKAASQVYPSLGIGAEVGYHQRLSLSDLYSPQIYGYVYGYLPGLLPQQGLRLTALVQRQLSALRTENAVKTRPRGLTDDSLDSFLAANAPTQVKLTADYAIPFWVGDISALSPLVYIKNFVFTPHFDYTAFRYGNGLSGSGALFSAGADLTINSANLLWFPFDCEIGLSYNYNGGRSFDSINASEVALKRNTVGFVFRTSL